MVFVPDSNRRENIWLCGCIKLHLVVLWHHLLPVFPNTYGAWNGLIAALLEVSGEILGTIRYLISEILWGC